MAFQNPFATPAPRDHVTGDFSDEEVVLASRNHSIALEALRYDVTPIGLHYLLQHFDIPYIPDIEAWRLEITGRVTTALSLSLAEIKGLPQTTVRVTLECAGNGRAHHAPRYPSMPWMYGAVGTAEWTGTPLADVLKTAGLDREAIEIAFIGADRGFDRGHEHSFGRSLKIAEALSANVLLVHAMNGQPLPPQHGAPVRLIVPGWYGMASVKWLQQIVALEQPFDGYQQVHGYQYKSAKTDPGVPITHIRVKSLMAPPGIPDWYTQHRLVDAGSTRVHGRAWSGAGVPIAKVEFGVNDQWRDAVLKPTTHRFAWSSWHVDWEARPGNCVLSCRATDANGAVQPLTSLFDRGGYGGNSVQKVEVTVR